MSGSHRGLEQGTESPGTGAKDSCKPSCGMTVHMHRHTCVEGGQTGRWAFPSVAHFPSLTEPNPAVRIQWTAVSSRDLPLPALPRLTFHVDAGDLSSGPLAFRASSLTR